jgi:signal transduction histidine kinase
MKKTLYEPQHCKNNDFTKESLNELSLMQHSARLLHHLIDQLLDLSKLEAGTVKISKETVYINHIIRNIYNQFRTEADEKGLYLCYTTALGDTDAYITTDSFMLIQVLRYLLNNAIKFTKKDKRIRVTVSCDDDWVTVAVADQGVGIPQSKLDRVFGKFIQVHYPIWGIYFDT